MSTWIKPKLKKVVGDDSPSYEIVASENVRVKKSLLVIVLDISPGQKYVREDGKALFHAIDAFIAFGNAHCLLDAENEVAVIASHCVQTHFLYPAMDEHASKLSTRQVDGQYEGFLEFESIVRQTLKRVIASRSYVDSNVELGNTSCLSNALGRALCYINRKQKYLEKHYDMNARIVVLSGSSDVACQYMSFMNCFFAAVRLKCVIDCCVMAQYATILSQGADITKGMFLRPPNGHKGLLQLLLWSLLPEKSLRSQLAQPPAFPIDYRAACFCHRNMISFGYVCSMCLSIYCSFNPFCTTCKSVFKPPGGPRFISRVSSRQ